MSDCCGCNQPVEVSIPDCALPRPAAKQPEIREGTWWVWDVKKRDYVDTGVPAQGPQGEPGPQGQKGDPGESGLTQEEADERYVQKEPEEASQTIKGQLDILAKNGAGLVVIQSPYITATDNISKSGMLCHDTLVFENWDDDEEKNYSIAITPGSRKTEDADAETGLSSVPMITFEDQYGYGSGVILSGVKEPTDDYDAANKKYVDEAIAAAVGGISAVLDAINGEVV